jgi:hypothetical protein
MNRKGAGMRGLKIQHKEIEGIEDIKETKDL